MDTNPDQGVTDLMAALDSTPPDEVEQVAEIEPEEVSEAEAVEEEVTPDHPPETAEDEEELEFEGKKFKGPKAVKEALLRQQDYTRKTQEVAERRQAVEDREQFLEAQQHFMQVASSEIAELQALQKRVAQFEQIDWSALLQSDSNQALALKIEHDNLSRKLTATAHRVQSIAKHAQEAKQKHEENQRALNAGELQRRLGKVSDSDRARIVQTAAELGIPEKQMWVPEVLHALDLASKYLALQKTVPKAARTLAEAPKVIKPSAPQPVRPNQAALDRLKKTGRAENLIDFL